MTKYSVEFKMNIVQDYLNGEGGTPYLAKKYGFKGDSQVRNWINAYKEFGKEGLLHSRRNKTYSVQFKLDAIELYLTTEMSYREVANQFGVSTFSTIANWYIAYQKNGVDGLSQPKGRPSKIPKKKNKLPVSDSSKTELTYLEELEKENRRLKIELAYFKRIKEVAFEGTTEQQALIIHNLREKFRLIDILETLGFPKSTYMYWQQRFNRKNPDKQIEEEMIKIHQEHKDYGYRRMNQELRHRGILVNKKKVQRLMKKIGILVRSFTRKSRKYNSYKGTVGRVAKNRIHRRFYTSIVHQKMTTDTTEFKYYEKDHSGSLCIKKLYLNPFMDMYNSEIISYTISEKPTAHAIMSALKEAIEKTSDCTYRRTFHSDQGWGYQMKAYSHELKKHQIYQSMSRKGNCLDNSPMENFFSILKQELYHGVIYKSYQELKQAIEHYIKYYNHSRIKEKLGWQSPVQFRKKMSFTA
ncbi:IS3 family transposase [Carnobacterium maltaromaticum]|nr:IS3 family transposase [Carnobacterium maltaromaticum]MDW5523150.1 IS3 family transposase [Carnobacterium maltaromaticum]